MLDNVVSIMEHTVAHISHPSDTFLTQVESHVVQLLLSGASSVSAVLQFIFILFVSVY